MSDTFNTLRYAAQDAQAAYERFLTRGRVAGDDNLLDVYGRIATPAKILEVLNELSAYQAEMPKRPSTLSSDPTPWFHYADALAKRCAGLTVELEAARKVVDAAFGLCCGYDWNAGNMAVLHGYRRKLLVSVNAIRPVPDFEGKSTTLAAGKEKAE